jgi:transposase
MKKLFIGVDVSKEKLDFCLLSDGKIVSEWISPNSTVPIKEGLNKLKIDFSETLICAEYTGQYTYPLCCVCQDDQIDLWLENPSQIKLSSGFKRGKNDKLDARNIAAYAERFQDKACLFSMPEKHMVTLKQLLSERDMYVADHAKYQGQLTDQERFMDKEDFKKKSQRMKKLLNDLEASIARIDKEIKHHIDSDETLAHQFKLLCSVDGIGERTAVKMIVVTNAFKDFKNPRKFCCHAGVAPFSYISGSSQHSRNKVSNKADKSIKALLHMAALVVATRTKGELHDYYLRKVGEGKNKMTVINAVRAKLIHRMFAVIRNNAPYQKIYHNSLA